MTPDGAAAAILQLRVSAFRLGDAADELRDAVAALTGVGIDTDWQSPAATSYRSQYQEVVHSLGGVVGLTELAAAAVDAEIARLGGIAADG